MVMLKSLSESYVMRSIKLLPTRVRRKVYLVISIQIFMGFLDLLGLAVVGVIGSLAVNGIQSKEPVGRVAQILDLLRISELTFQTQVAVLGLIATALLVSRTLFSVIIIRRTIYFLSRRSSELSNQLVRKLLSQDLLFVRQKSTQETLFALTSGTSSVTTGVIGALVSLIADLSLLIVLASGLLFVDFAIAAGTFVLFGLVGIFLYFNLQKKAHNLGEQSTKLTIKSNEKLLQVLSSYREMIVRNRRFFFAREINETQIKLADVSAELAFMPNISKYTLEAATIFGILLIAATQFLGQDASHAVASLSIFLVAGARIAPAILRMQQGAIQIKSSIAAAKPTFDFIESLSLIEEIQDPGAEIDFLHKDFAPTVFLKDVHFRYPGAKDDSVADVNLEIQEGEQIAIVGASGAGKTTLVDLILGVIKPCSGEIKVAGLSPKEAIRDWSGAIAYVPQEINIASGTILENISLGFPLQSVDKDYLERALRLAKLEEFVNALPEGVNTNVGESGSRLSGGQKQRIALARALYSNPKIIVLDEATSSLDAETEFEISNAIKDLKGEITVILIAHRLSTVRDADKVVYLENGRVMSVGDFDFVRRNVPNFNKQADLMGLN
jgi:ATP-binding cassette, subfamily B, bacterial PglK